MKVVRICQEYLPLVSGPIKQAAAAVEGLASDGHESLVMTSTAGVERNVFSIEKPSELVTINRYRILQRVMRYYFLADIASDLRMVSADILHVHGWRNGASDTAIRIAKRRGIPVVLQVHGSANAENIVTGLRRRLPYKAYDALFKSRVPLRADAVVAATSQEKSECVAYGFAKERITIIPSGIDANCFESMSRKRSRSATPPRVLIVGRLSRDRNVELALRAAQIVKEWGVAFELRIVGGEEKRTQTSRAGYLDELRSLVGELGLWNEVTFAGPVAGSGLVQEYVDADVFVYTSIYENFGNTVLEAAAANLPLLVTPTGVAPDLVVDGETGYLVSMTDPLDLAVRLEGLLVHGDSAKRMGVAAGRFARAEYDWPHIVKRYEALYLSLIANGRSQPNGA